MPKLGIRTRFTLILSVIFIVAIVVAWAVFSRVPARSSGSADYRAGGGVDVDAQLGAFLYQ